MKKLLCLLLCMCMFVAISVAFPQNMNAEAVSSKIFTVTANPGQDCNTQVGISWTSSFTATACKVQYAPKSTSDWTGAITVNGKYDNDDYKYFIGNTYATADGTKFTEDHKFLKYTADLTNLTPATEYKYRIYDGTDYSATRYFKTSGRDSYDIVWISDFHTYKSTFSRLTSATSCVNYAISQSKNGVDAVFSTGDTVAYGGSYNFWEQVYNTAWVKNNLYIDLNGNHDNMNNTDTNNTFNYFRTMHNNPKNCFLGSSTTPYEPGVVYWFLYNDILWFVFDNETMSASIRTQVQEWAGKVIDSMAGKYKYLFISEHYQWFSGSTGADSHYGNWKAFCDKYGVDVAFAGNNHIYARTHKLYNGTVQSASSTKGTYYVQAASSDGERGSSMNSSLSYNSSLIAARYTGPTVSSAIRTQGVSLISVTPSGITITAYSGSGSASSPTFTKKDSFTVTPRRADVVPVNPAEKGYYTTDASLAMYETYSTSAQKLTTIPSGKNLAVSATNGSWGRVCYNGYTGWVNLNDLTCVYPDATVAAPTNYPTTAYNTGWATTGHTCNLYTPEYGATIATGDWTFKWNRTITAVRDSNGAYKVTVLNLENVEKSNTAIPANGCVINIAEGDPNYSAIMASLTVGSYFTYDKNMLMIYPATPGTAGKPVIIPGTEPEKLVLKSNSGYKTSEGFLKSVKPGTATSNIVNAFDNDDVRIKSYSGTTLTSTDAVGTGAVISYYLSDGTLMDSVTVVISGDINGDASLTSSDYLAVSAYVTGGAQLKAVFAEAADVNTDASVSASDYMRILSHITGASLMY